MRQMALSCALALCLSSLAINRAAAVIRYTGVNLAGAEFGSTPTPGNLGTYGSAYIYPNSSEVDYYLGKGLNTFRLPFRWERMQPTQAGPLSTAELARMDAFVNYATAQGGTVIVEPHNFQRYYPDPNNFQQSAQGLVGTAVPNSAYADFWSKMADHYKDNGRVIFNLMNEPTTLPTEQLVTSTNAAIAAIRATGATNTIHVPGNAYTGAHSWTQNWYGTANSVAMLNVVDPAKNMVYEVHQYFDNDSSGTSTQIGTNANLNNTNIGVERITAFTNWLRTNHKKGFLGEFALANARFGEPDGTGSTAKIADETLQATLNYMQANADVWEGWAWWGGGPWWGNYMFRLDPTALPNPTPAQEQPAMAYLVPYVAGNPVELPGDFNLDDVVNGDDLLLFNMSNGRSGLDLAADADDDGSIDGADILAWQQTLGQTTPAIPVGGAVPEPSAALLMLAALPLLRRLL